MFLIRKGHVAVLLLTLGQSLSFATVNHEKKETKASVDMITSYLRLPWTVGLDRIVNFPESLGRTEVAAWIRGIESGEPWAMQLLDSFSENQVKLQETDIQHSEVKNECPMAESDNVDVRDRHCMIENDPAQIGPFGSNHFTTAEISTIFLFLTLVVLLSGCTICDFVKRNHPEYSSPTVNTLAKFSLYTNAISLIEPETNPGTMTAIHGIRSLCCLCVINGHRYVVSSIVLRHKITLLDMLKLNISVRGLFLKMNLNAVDTFCVISGFLTAYLFIRTKKSGIKFNLLVMYIRRYLRITPCMVAVMLFVIVFADRCGHGPLWQSIATAGVDSCRQNWWVNLLYLQNIVSSDRLCLPFTWYLAFDMQFFWLSPMILYPLYHSPKFGLRLLSFLFVISILTPPILLVVNGYFNGMVRFDYDFPTLLENFRLFYITSYSRAFPHLLGVFLGYDVATKRRHLTQANLTLIWIFIGFVTLYWTWATYRLFLSSFAFDLSMEILTSILLRPSWSIITAWIIYACTQGYGGLLNRFLSLPIFLPISRLSFTIYMVHMVIQTVTISYFQPSTPFWGSDFIIGYCGDLVLSIALALVLNLFIERPVVVLTNILLANQGHQTKSVSQSKRKEKTLELETKNE